MKISNSVKSNPNQTFFSASLFMCTTIIYLLPIVRFVLFFRFKMSNVHSCGPTKSYLI
eukprot:06229.XXX_368898_369071_1 [CDS] Oithona nana genome sequencing.